MIDEELAHLFGNFHRLHIRHANPPRIHITWIAPNCATILLLLQSDCESLATFGSIIMKCNDVRASQVRVPAEQVAWGGQGVHG